MFKKVVFLSVVAFVGFVAFSAIAQVTSNMAPVIVGAPATSVFNWKVFAQQILTNGGFVLLSFLASKIPGIGPVLKKMLDVFMANPEHP